MRCLELKGTRQDVDLNSLEYQPNIIKILGSPDPGSEKFFRVHLHMKLSYIQIQLVGLGEQSHSCFQKLINYILNINYLF